MTVRNCKRFSKSKRRRFFSYISSEQFPLLKRQECINPGLDAFSIVLLPNEWPIIFLDFSGRDIIRLTNVASISWLTGPPPPPGLLFFLPNGNLPPKLCVFSVSYDCLSLLDDWVLADSVSVLDDWVSAFNDWVSVLDEWVSVLDDWVSALDVCESALKDWVFKFCVFPLSSVWGHADGIAKPEHPGLGWTGEPPQAPLFLLLLDGPPPPPPALSVWSQ